MNDNDVGLDAARGDSTSCTRFSGDPLETGTMTGHDAPELQGQVKFVTGSAPTGKITLSADGAKTSS
jgi:hypothetical protein